MDIILYIIITLILIVLVSCIFFSYWETINNYLIYGFTDIYYRYTPKIVDQTDINYIKAIVPTNIFKDTVNQIAEKEIIKCPNGAITDDVFLKDANKKYNNETPWDRDVVSCDIIHDKDRDLYKNVLNNNAITIY